MSQSFPKEREENSWGLDPKISSIAVSLKILKILFQSPK
jgi:hypothetical protein